MDINEFLNQQKEKDNQAIIQDQTAELDVQKAVVESLAADKAVQDERITTLNAEKQELIEKIEKLECEISELNKKIAHLNEEFGHIGEVLSKNSEETYSNSISLLDKSPEINDRFTGEARDHVIEVIREARNAAEKDGHIRRAQVLESVLVANESSGELEKRRNALKKLFAENQNLINGQVINELDKLGIKYKLGEKYLLVDEIIKNSY